MFVYRTTIHMHQTDAAGVLFYGHLFSMIHEAYEEALKHMNLSVRDILKEHDFLLPIVHAEADYIKPLMLGEVLEIQIVLEKKGHSSITLQYRLLNPHGEVAAAAKTIHAAVDKKTHHTIPLPKILRDRLRLLFGEDFKKD